ncbi:hypothetical protein P3T36_004374 [Kitasatospora sp. MAP12-15]|uniref:DUF5719 family protein n=1 Tax=unclassified Kitasatospora TaxID=2633591 RepID=UPI002476A884|nr:DUF5719 family protein [Kitasatospora sp. MAP12-44]MDH6110800.1 hypothetical protein [Kitasatospora sp. MAP12-44]
MKKPALKKPTLKKPELSLKRPGPAALGGASRTGVSLLAAAGVLVLVLGVAEARPPAAPAGPAAGAAVTAQVERTAAVCPQPMQGLTGTTTITALTPGAGGSTAGGSGTVTVVNPPTPVAAAPSPAPSGAPAGSPPPSPAASAPAAPAPAAGQAPPAPALLTLTKPGVPVSVQAPGGDTAPGSSAVATGAYAPGFTVTQTTIVTDQRGMGMSGVTCQPDGTDFWFAGAAAAGDRADYVDLTNVGAASAVVDIKLYGAQGEVDSDAAAGIAVPPGGSQAVLLSTLTNNTAVNDLAVEVVARSGRISANLHASDGSNGSDWIPASVAPAPSQVLAGLPADLSAMRLIVMAPGGDDADLKIQLSGQNGWFTPAGHETIHVKAGMVNAVDLGQITRGEVSALRLTPSDPQNATPVVAGLRVDRGGSGKSDSAWLTGSLPIGQRATVADVRGGGASTLYLTATGDAATVRVTASAGTGGGTPTTKDVQVPAGATVSLPSPEPAGGTGNFGVSLQTLTGGPVVAARMLAVNTNSVPMFTIQALNDDHSNVVVPQADQDPGILAH